MSNLTLPSVGTHMEEWSLSESVQPILFSIIFPFTSLILMSFPQHFERWLAVTMVLASAYAAFTTSDNLSPDYTFNEIYSRYIIIGGSYMLMMAYKIDKSKKVQTHLEYKGEQPTWSPWYKGYKMMWNIRGVGTSWENPYLWPGTKYASDASKSSTDARKINSAKGSRHNLASRGRRSAVAIRLGYVALNFFLLACLYELVNLEFLIGAGLSDYNPEKESIVRRLLQTSFGHGTKTPVIPREFQVRAISAFQNTTADFLLFSLYHDVCAVFFIAVGLDESWEWPPFFGQLMEAYTMRRWWSMWWHRTIYRSFNSHSELIMKPFGMKKGSLLYRTLTAFTIFGLSAVMHSLVTWKHGNSCAWGRSMVYWILHPVAFIFEGFVQTFWRTIRSRMDRNRSLRALDIFERVVGYVWVSAFLMWVDPKYYLPLRNCALQSESPMWLSET